MRINSKIKKYAPEFKVGIVFFIALIILFVVLFSIRETTFWKGTYILKVKFNFSEGLRPASPVRFCGVDVGEVKKVTVVEENNQPIVYVYAKISQDIHIPKNSTFIINSLSLFGEKYLEIVPPQKIEGFFSENEVAEGISPLPLFTVFSNFHKTMSEINEFVREGKLKTSFENTLTNIEAITGNLKNILEDIKREEGTVGKFIYDPALYQKLEELLDELKRNPWKLFYKPKETKSK
ncbi:MAG: MlaD family protein [Candidatus Omnitrophica bacterium]|nr:MlaD family protein [Candidatus Omnitrophota bacterium]